ncbi:MAG: ABC-F family ATP-binding cassette domain-containing protein, partial [Planctomycetes bacterium]|nr:ABC-F family ATP-binding cassette domain-containing protein [Planctomycetota bacterium]
ILTQVGFVDAEQPANLLSGGWRKRLSLACELIRRPEVLLLDEPTNHLDLPGVIWLEQLLRAAPFGYLIVTHDRAFLRAVADEVVEISRVYPGGSFRSAGSYDEFADRRDEFLEAQARYQASVANQVRRETEWLGHKARARTRKASSRIEDAAKRRDELDELKYRNATASTAGIDFVATGRQTRKLLNATGISKSVAWTTDGEATTSATRSLFSGLDLMLSPGTKLGLLGPNGCGKSTLLKVLSGEIESDTGTITRADGLRVVVFEQGRESLDPKITLKHALCPNGDTVMYRDRSMHIAAWAKQFLFQPEQLNGLIGDLSGGERARVRIAQLMLQPADLLLLDEPTNDLDIPALEVLEDSLEEFPGALVIVSHDRELLDRLCKEVIGLDGKGGASLYGSVDQWLTAFEKGISSQKTESRAAAKTENKPAPKARAKMSYREQQEWAGMEAAILTAENKVIEKQTAVEMASVGGHLVLIDACKELEEAQRHVEKLYARWQELETKQG